MHVKSLCPQLDKTWTSTIWKLWLFSSCQKQFNIISIQVNIDGHTFISFNFTDSYDKRLQSVSVLVVGVNSQQFPFFLTRVLQALRNKINSPQNKALHENISTISRDTLTKTLNSRGALCSVPLGASALGMCSREKAVGRILMERRITKQPLEPLNAQQFPG